MTLASLGKVTVPTPGTPVQLSVNSVVCSQVFMAAVPANAGIVAVGNASVNATTYAGAVKVFLKPATTGPLDTLVITEESGEGDPLDLSKIYIDAVTAGDGAIFGYAVE